MNILLFHSKYLGFLNGSNAVFMQMKKLEVRETKITAQMQMVKLALSTLWAGWSWASFDPTTH